MTEAPSSTPTPKPTSEVSDPIIPPFRLSSASSDEAAFDQNTIGIDLTGTLLEGDEQQLTIPGGYEQMPVSALSDPANSEESGGLNIDAIVGFIMVGAVGVGALVHLVKHTGLKQNRGHVNGSEQGGDVV